MITSNEDMDHQEEAERIIASIKSCVDRGEGKGICHVFLDHSDVCVCGKLDLSRERLK